MDRLDATGAVFAADVDRIDQRAVVPAGFEISQIVSALVRINDPEITDAIGKLTERLTALMDQVRRDRRTIHYTPSLTELLVNEPHGVPYCR
jgi:hypothetical protein